MKIVIFMSKYKFNYFYDKFSSSNVIIGGLEIPSVSKQDIFISGMLQLGCYVNQKRMIREDFLNKQNWIFDGESGHRLAYFLISQLS